jgi:serralysin
MQIPNTPTISVSKNADGYIVGNTPFFFGIGDPGAQIEVFSGGTLLGGTTVDDEGFWNLLSIPLGDGAPYAVYAKAIDMSGTSASSAQLSFGVDVHPPAVPVGDLATDGQGNVSTNQPVFAGSAEAGTRIALIRDGAALAYTEADANGYWSVTPAALANGSYSVVLRSADLADNITYADVPLAFNLSSTLNRAGGGGNDVLTGSVGNNGFDGQAGVDTAVFTGAHADYAINPFGNRHLVTARNGEIDTLLNVERIRFSDVSVAIDVNGAGGQTYRLYQAAFDRPPEATGAGFWMDQIEQGVSLHDVAGAFMASAEFASLYGNNPSNEVFIGLLYDNVLNREPDPGGFAFWVNELSKPEVDRASVLVAFSESPENQAQVIETIAQGFEYIPFG